MRKPVNGVKTELGTDVDVTGANLVLECLIRGQRDAAKYMDHPAGIQSQ